MPEIIGEVEGAIQILSLSPFLYTSNTGGVVWPGEGWTDLEAGELLDGRKVYLLTQIPDWANNGS